MTAKAYLKQAYRLDQKINSDISEAQRLREIATGISSPTLGDKVQSSRPAEAAFASRIEKIIDMEKRINHEIDILVDLKEQMHDVIAAVPNTDENMVLRYRYIHNMTWGQIGDELHADASTVRRWHGKALTHVVIPENPVVI